jgi:hypothetical protein
VAETNGLLNRRTGKSGTEGSNPSVSANPFFALLVHLLHFVMRGWSDISCFWLHFVGCIWPYRNLEDHSGEFAWRLLLDRAQILDNALHCNPCLTRK